MARYPDNFVQVLPAGVLETLPEFAEYDGPARDLQHLKGLLIPTKDIDKVVYVGERENIYVTMPDGIRKRPWLGCQIFEVDAQGNEVVRYNYEPLPPEPPPGAMDRSELEELGWSDQELWDAAKELFGETHHYSKEASLERRRLWERVTAALMG